MTVVTGSDIFSNTWNTFYKVISGNVLDPASRGSQWIFRDYPQIQEGKTDEHPGFPIITIEPFENNGTLYTFSNMNNSLTSTITVHTRTKRHIDIISDSINSAITSNRKTLGASGLHNLEFTQGGVETYTSDRYNKIHMKNIGIKVDTVI